MSAANNTNTTPIKRDYLGRLTRRPGESARAFAIRCRYGISLPTATDAAPVKAPDKAGNKQDDKTTF
jgi:hypothetical protein